MGGMRRSAVVAACTAAGVAAAVAYGRHRQLGWGASATEVRSRLPGDDDVPDADLVTTRAITIQAPPEDVWPWIAQLGRGRGGFYTYDRLENAIGLGIHSADAIVPEWQAIAVGDRVELAEDLALTVIVADAPTALVLAGRELPAGARMPFAFTWAFVLASLPDGTTRLLIRERYGYRTPGAALVVEPTTWISFLMTRRMLRGIRHRAQRTTSRTT